MRCCSLAARKPEGGGAAPSACSSPALLEAGVKGGTVQRAGVPPGKEPFQA